MVTIACYSFSLAPVTWVLIAEIVPNRIRGAAVAVSALWIACFILTYTFPLLNRALGPARTFWLYATTCAAGFVFIFFRVPETKGNFLKKACAIQAAHILRNDWQPASTAAAYRDPARPVDERVRDLPGRMTLEERSPK